MDEWEDDQYEIDGVGFAQEGSALRRETRDNPRNLPCPNCHDQNVLTPLDVANHYQCDRCADAVERGGEGRWCEREECAMCDAL